MTISPCARTTAFLLAFVLGSASSPAISAPAPDPAQDVELDHAKMAAMAEKALLAQGGSRIVFKVDADGLREALATELRDDVVKTLREERIPYAGLAMHDGGVELRITDAGNRQRLASRLIPPAQAASSGSAAIDVADSGDGLMRLAPSASGFAERLQRLVGESIDLIEQDLRNNGVRLAGVRTDGADRIRVTLPDIRDPDRLAAAITRKARIAFRLVDVSMTPAQAQQNAPPPGSEVLTDFKTKAPYLLLKDVAVEGDDISEAAPGFFASTQQPIVNFRFNARGARRFAHVTAENIGRPFAVVIDDQVISAPVIREPITAGSGQISGNFTLQEANSIAMLLRSGTLPGRLTVVDRQVIESAASPGKP